jgi:hypothetical protein
MKLCEYSDADVCRYLDDQIRYLDKYKDETYGWVYFYTKIYQVNLCLGNRYSFPHSRTLLFSEYKNIFVSWRYKNDTPRSVYPARDPLLKTQPWAKMYENAVGKRHYLSEVCQIIRHVDRINRLIIFA